MKVVLIGLGEVGFVIGDLLGPSGHSVAAYDVAFADAGSRASLHAARLGLDSDSSLAHTVGNADCVISAVTPRACSEAALAAAPYLLSGAWFFDLNSSSPRDKQKAAAAVTEAGGRYVEVALMSPILPQGLDAPFLLGGPHAEAFTVQGRELGLTDMTVVSGSLGTAAATKLCRSVIIKGTEALFVEALLTARRLGVEQEVLGSLANILPHGDWDQLAGYFLERSVRHGRRRSEEMLEAARMVGECGFDSWMSEATARRHQWAGALNLSLKETLPVPDILDAVLACASLGRVLLEDK